LFYQVKIRLGSRRRLKNRNSGRGPRTPIIARRSSAVLTAMTPESLATADASRLLLICQRFFMLVKQHQHLWMTCPDLLLTDEPYPGVERLKARFHGHAYDPYRQETSRSARQSPRARRTAIAAPSGSVPAGVHSLSHPDKLHDGHASGENLTLDAQCRGRFSARPRRWRPLRRRTGIHPLLPTPRDKLWTAVDP
jgi:hypothetical protein